MDTIYMYTDSSHCWAGVFGAMVAIEVHANADSRLQKASGSRRKESAIIRCNNFSHKHVQEDTTYATNMAWTRDFKMW